MIRLVRPLVGINRRTGYRPDSYHLDTDLPQEVVENRRGNQAIKKPGLNNSSTGITSVPGLFSELFNVAASRPAQMTTEYTKASPGQAFRQGLSMVNRSPKPHREEAPLRRLKP
ncbi:MAG: hypothetical protein NVSMB20_04310 [Bradyrhizobium sp.]